MGICVSSSHATSKVPAAVSPSAMVVDLDGRLKEFRRPITVAEVVSLHPNCYLCCSDAMLIDSHAPQLPGDHVLQIGQIYFLISLSKLLTPLSLHDFCHLAIKATSLLTITSYSATYPHQCTT